jgi:hypothetical protein
METKANIARHSSTRVALPRLANQRLEAMAIPAADTQGADCSTGEIVETVADASAVLFRHLKQGANEATNCREVAGRALLLGLVLVACAFTGCQSASQYISPRLEGRVLDGQTQQPIAGVKVHRVTPPSPDVDQPQKGDEALERTPAVRTGKDGTFILDSERDIELLQRTSWYAVTFAFEKPGYISFSTNYTLANATITASGEPRINAGNILLMPQTK